MTFSADLRLIGVILFEFQCMNIKDVSFLLGASVHSIRNRINHFKKQDQLNHSECGDNKLVGQRMKLSGFDNGLKKIIHLFLTNWSKN
jgi:hypothetical protein